MTTYLNQTFDSIDINSIVQGDFPVKTRRVTIAGGNVYARGTVLGHETAGDIYTIATSAASDGSSVPVGVLATDVDSTTGPIVADVYFTGEFGDRMLTYGVGHTAATVEASFRETGRDLFIRVLPVLG